MYYEMEIAGVKRQLQLFPINKETSIAAFIIFGDVEVTEASAKELLAKAPDFDYIFTAEAKSIPLAYEMAKQSGNNDYIIARKSPKVYLKDYISVPVNSITTEYLQQLYLGEGDAAKISGKKVLIVDDVISTGESLAAMERLVEKAGGIIVGKMSILAEGDAIGRDDIIYLKPLPLFDTEGNPKA
ncbi:MAG: phosphoribosyltransferase family protein [Firmicutes bacterium]|nr:phosphoribosyltransferase family protein [Bacillota bacterium]